MQGNARKIYYLVVMGIAVVVALLLVPTQKEGRESKKSQPNADKTRPVKATKPSKDSVRLDAKARSERLKKARERLRKQQTVQIENKYYIATISNLNAGLTSFQLKGARFKDKENGGPIDLITTDKERFYPLGMQLLSSGTNESVLNEDALWKIEKTSNISLRLSYRAEDLKVARKIEAVGGPYQLWVTTTITNLGTKRRSLIYRISSHHYVAKEKEEAGIPFLPVRSPAISHGICHHAVNENHNKENRSVEFETERFDKKELLQPHLFKGPIHFAGVESVYFLKAISPHPQSGPNRADSCLMQSSNRGVDSEGEPLGRLFSTQVAFPATELESGKSRSYRVLAYFGPKMPDDLLKAGHSYNKAIDLGFFAILSEGLTWLLRKINSVVGNWGIAIILLTLFVKVVLYPLTAKSFQSMARMRVLKPEMDRINEMYKDDREKKGAAIMELYRKHKINPLGGCLPQLLQLPIWIALYTSLSTNIELFHAPFALWWQDLSSPDPFYVLPIALGILMFLQQKMTPMTTMDPMQAKMMQYMMPAMMMSFMLFLPAGLCLYILTNSALTIGQQRIIEHRLKQVAATPSSVEMEASMEGTIEDNKPELAKYIIGSKKPKPNKSKRRSRRGRK